MPAALDAHARRVRQLRHHVAQAHRALGEVREHVGEGERRSQALERREFRDQAVQQPVEQLALARERAVAAAEHLVLELLELGRDEPLGVLDRLAALVVERRALRLAARQLDVVAVHAVVGDLELGNAGAAPLAFLEVEQVRVRAGRDRAQLVERRVVARGDDAALAQERRRRRDDRAPQEILEAGLRSEVRGRGLPAAARRGRRAPPAVRGSAASASRNAARSRGRAERSATRASTRSTSPMPRRISCRPS